LKFKVGHRRPSWKNWSYDYPEQDGKDEILHQVFSDLGSGELEMII